MPFAESTIRLLLRDLEDDGWIEMLSTGEDRRIRSFHLTEKFLQMRAEWLLEAEKLLLDTSSQPSNSSLTN